MTHQRVISLFFCTPRQITKNKCCSRDINLHGNEGLSTTHIMKQCTIALFKSLPPLNLFTADLIKETPETFFCELRIFTLSSYNWFHMTRQRTSIMIKNTFIKNIPINPSGVRAWFTQTTVIQDQLYGFSQKFKVLFSTRFWVGFSNVGHGQ